MNGHPFHLPPSFTLRLLARACPEPDEGRALRANGKPYVRAGELPSVRGEPVERTGYGPFVVSLSNHGRTPYFVIHPSPRSPFDCSLEPVLSLTKGERSGRTVWSVRGERAKRCRTMDGRPFSLAYLVYPSTTRYARAQGERPFFIPPSRISVPYSARHCWRRRVRQPPPAHHRPLRRRSASYAASSHTPAHEYLPAAVVPCPPGRPR